MLILELLSIYVPWMFQEGRGFGCIHNLQLELLSRCPEISPLITKPKLEATEDVFALYGLL
jgi:hypothetical protein